MSTRRWLLAALPALGCIACGPPPNPPPADAGVDTSCGLDCAAQSRYGLLVDRCFEYSDTTGAADPAVLGVQVKPVLSLEGGVGALPVEYRQGGQIRMTDHFRFDGQDLLLARRAVVAGESITYKDGGGAITGLAWFKEGVAAGQNFDSSAEADLISGGSRVSEPTTLRVDVLAASTAERTVPAGTFAEALKLGFNETPFHGGDPQRVLAEGTGFILLSTRFSLTSTGTAQPYRLQRIRDLGTTEAGPEECGLGSP
jgi:hypothetical protein